VVTVCVSKRLLTATEYITPFPREQEWTTNFGTVTDVVCQTTEHGIVNIVARCDVTTVAELKRAFIVCNYNYLYEGCDYQCEKCRYFPQMRLVSLDDLRKEIVPIS